MRTYTLEELNLDLSTIEKREIDLDRISLPKGITFIKPYSSWLDKRLTDSVSVEDISNRVITYLKECAIPELSSPIPTDDEYVLFAGYTGQVLDILIVSNDLDVVKAEFTKALESVLSYTAVGVVIKNDSVTYSQRKVH